MDPRNIDYIKLRIYQPLSKTLGGDWLGLSLTIVKLQQNNNDWEKKPKTKQDVGILCYWLLQIKTSNIRITHFQKNNIFVHSVSPFLPMLSNARFIQLGHKHHSDILDNGMWEMHTRDASLFRFKKHSIHFMKTATQLFVTSTSGYIL